MANPPVKKQLQMAGEQARRGALLRSSVTRNLCVIALSCILSLISNPSARSGRAWAQGQIMNASTQRQSRDAAIAAIPFQNLNLEAQQKISGVLKKTSLYRRMPIQSVNCDHELHQFLIRYPEVIVGIWKLMGITSVEATRVAPFQIHTNDGAGTDSDCELIYGTRGLHIYYCDGTYEGSLFKNKLNGKCLLVLQSEYSTGPAGEPLVADRLDVFLQIDNIGANVLAKTLHPLVGKTADHNFTESEKFLTRLSEAAETNPAGMQHLAEDLEDCDKEVRERFADVIANVGYRYASRVTNETPRRLEPAISNATRNTSIRPNAESANMRRPR
jgi:hypothetical protein